MTRIGASTPFSTLAQKLFRPPSRVRYLECCSLVFSSYATSMRSITASLKMSVISKHGPKQEMISSVLARYGAFVYPVCQTSKEASHGGFILLSLVCSPQERLVIA